MMTRGGPKGADVGGKATCGQGHMQRLQQLHALPPRLTSQVLLDQSCLSSPSCSPACSRVSGLFHTWSTPYEHTRAAAVTCSWWHHNQRELIQSIFICPWVPEKSQLRPDRPSRECTIVVRPATCFQPSVVSCDRSRHRNKAIRTILQTFVPCLVHVFEKGELVDVLLLMFKKPQATLHNHVLEDGTRWNIDRLAFSGNDNDSALECDATTKVDSASDCQVVQLKDPGNAWNT